MGTPRITVFPLQLVRVVGPSMSPTLRDGDVVLVRHGASVRRGDVVLARFRGMPERLVLKRADHEVGGAWWLVSDNAAALGDSSVHGVADVIGRVILRRPAGSMFPRRVPRKS